MIIPNINFQEDQKSELNADVCEWICSLLSYIIKKCDRFDEVKVARGRSQY
ncbi:hypothetical protein WJM97_10300 [Okeanomitos corallinicola TIOX110]|uniref:Uncharacterized protein n=1 Tax=Okeanomitos corallinicola TIOX110 TaxID=3133117 RepID=A0ABZ2UXJ4_9CYAN